MNPSAKIYVAGHRGLVGSAIVRKLTNLGYPNLVMSNSSEVDLRDPSQVSRFFAAKKPEYVFLAAAKVGGILANQTYPAEFIYDNLMIQANVIDAAYRHGVKKLLFLGSSCIYPKYAEQPIKEQALLTGTLEPTNEPYAIAKIAGIKLCESYNRQYGTCFIPVMPTNIYGPGDNFHIENAHVLPALVRRFHEAKLEGKPTVEVWGTGRVRREFLHVDDLAEACVFIMEQVDDTRLLNIGVGKDLTIRELAQLVREVVGFEGEIVFDHSKPDGTPRKLLDVSRIHALGWEAKIGLREGIRSTYEWYCEEWPNARR